MALVTYIEHNGTSYKVEVSNGESVMRGALNHKIEGIVAECGGGLACATCHCYVDDAWIGRVGAPSQAEADMLECASSETTPGSRLSCQITISKELDGLIVRLPKTQI